ncbi:DinB family protein [Paenibacillus sp. TRM 82003]|nr:DUF664 domain-containing protein [Kineococcus sp. TRM81007]MCI2237400.1 DinB family protein [Kineococcus sp. TRM81007]MCI3919750.1 DinB family protein [Paenibacillus sp. TRM 82003]
MSKRLPLAGDEKTSLHISLDRHRDAVLWKLEGLNDEQLRRPMTPSGTNLLGLVKHLAGVEHEWLPKTYGRSTEPLETDVVADMNAGPHEWTAGIVAFYGRARAASDAVIDEHGIEDLGTAWCHSEWERWAS